MIRTKIFFVIGTLDVGGAETQLVELASRLDRSRYEPVVCCLAGGGLLQAHLRAAGVPVFDLGYTGLRRAGRSYLSIVPNLCGIVIRLWRLIRRERPDILHGVLFWSYVLGTFVGRLAGVPVIVASRRSLGLFKADKPHYLFLERLTDRMTDLFIANSEAVRRDTIEREPVDANRVIVIHNGLDFSRFDGPAGVAPDPPLAAEGRPRAIVVSNLIHYKGHEYFFRAWADVVNVFPAAVALLVGDGVYRTELERLADGLGIRHSLRFLGVRRDVPALLAAADIYVHPSLQEGYSNALLEAMAAARPVVATRVGGNVEAIDDGRTGLLVPARDSGALAAAMVRLFSEPALARGLGDAAGRAVRERFDVTMMVRQYEAVYDRLAGGRQPRPEPAGAPHAC